MDAKRENCMAVKSVNSKEHGEVEKCVDSVGFKILVDELYEAAKIILSHKSGRDFVKYSGFSTALTTISSGVGFFMLPPPFGVVTGASLGGLTSYLLTRGKYKSLVSIAIEDFTPDEQTLFKEHLMTALENSSHVLSLCTSVVSLVKNRSAIEIVMAAERAYSRSKNGSPSAVTNNTRSTSSNSASYRGVPSTASSNKKISFETGKDEMFGNSTLSNDDDELPSTSAYTSRATIKH